MSEIEYIVSLKKGVDYDAFNQEMIATTGAGDIPGRSVSVANARPGSARNTHYALTESEVVTLKNDSRVADVALPPEQDDDLEIGLNARSTGTFYQGTVESVTKYIDWGKRRHSLPQETESWSTSLAGSYDYSLDGTGVDVVIQDSGIQVGHPEFDDEYGNSRIQQIDWYTASGISGTQNANHYRDYDGHGTHCAGTTAGIHYGWAKNARIFSVKVNGLEGTGDSGTGISISDVFDVIKLWHRNKPIDPVTGQKRPTIVNMSWGYSTASDSLTAVNYRGTSFTTGNDGSFSATPNTHMRDTYGVYPYTTDAGYRAPVRVTSVDTDVEELIDEGVHVVIAAGNNSFKADLSGGDDYDNYFTRSGSNVYYHRGSSPYSTEAFMVGCLLAQSSTADNKVGFSTTGPGVDIYAAGHNIVSSTSSNNKFSDAAYWGNPVWRQCNISGTSMAAPQVCGLGALYLQANPMLTPAQLRSMIHNDSSETMAAGTLTGYGSTDNAMGGPRRVLVSRYTNNIPFTNTLSGKYSIRS
jgi:subtilisin family serine protease